MRYTIFELYQMKEALKLPAIQFYPGDWHKDQGVQALDLEQRGAWFEMLLMMHDSDERGVLLVNGVPMPEAVLARRLGLDNQKLNQILTTLLTFGVTSRRESDGAYFCRRMVKDEHIRKVRAAAGKKGGNPDLLKQNPKQTTKQIPTPSITSSTTLPSNEGKDGEPAAEPAPPLPAEEEKADPVSAPRRAEPDDDDQAATESPLVKPAAFQAILADLYPQLDYDYYRKEMLAKAPAGKMAVRSWRNWILKYMRNELEDARKAGKELLTPAAAPAPNELPTNQPVSVPLAIARIEEPELNPAFLQQQTDRQAQNMARLHLLATSTPNLVYHGASL